MAFSDFDLRNVRSVLKLDGQIASIDLRDSYIARDVDKILGILFEGIGLPVVPATA